ncbi:alcohol dehydrogenase catalytic domain-containing protein [Streptomyces niveus]|uniref:alcohol dehydrogenase catalytic domain-containing protein n=1 Tax=Streptomyces niveus TaxID=193462 RepID=UPI0036D866C5
MSESEEAAAVVAAAYGGPEVLSVISVAVPEPESGQVRVSVRAAGVNPFDYKVYSGTFGTDPEDLPLRLGVEAAGVVTAVGADAVGPAGPVAVGDEVIAYYAPGAYAGEIVVPASSVVPKPAALSWEQAGGLLAAGVTAVHVLEAIGLAKDETVLVHGASGGVGLVAVQLAVERGTTVVATASKAKHDLLRELGATPVAYGPGLADRVRAIAPEGVHAGCRAMARRTLPDETAFAAIIYVLVGGCSWRALPPCFGISKSYPIN